jgi:WD40 repeat protein
VTPRLTALLLALSAATAVRSQSLEPIGRLASRADVQFTAISPDGRHLAAACGDRRVRLLGLPDGREGPVLDNGSAAIGSLSFSRDGRRRAVGGLDGIDRRGDGPGAATLPHADLNGGGMAAGRLLLTSAEGDALKLWAVR